MLLGTEIKKFGEVFDVRESVFDLMKEEKMTHLQIHHNWRNGSFALYGAKEWEPNQKWSDFNKTFDVWTLLTDKAVYYNDEQCRALFAKHGISAYLEKIMELMRGARHCLEDFYYWEKEDIRFLNNIHSTKLGLENRRQSLVMGGIRRHVREEDEIDMIIDGMNLGRGMSFKNVAGHVPMGGCKITVMQDPLDLTNMENLAFLAYCNERTRNTTGPDMRFPTEMTGIIKKNWSLAITGDPNGPLGETGTPTAYGVFKAGLKAAKFLWGSEDVSGKKVAIQGLGSVGYHLAELYIEANADVTVADMDEATVKKLKAAYPKVDIKVADPTSILTTECDILVPSAIGGIITEEMIPLLRTKAIFGPANNQLRATNPDQEIAMAKKVAAAGILFQTEWMHNVAGVMAGYEEYINQEKASRENLYRSIDEVIEDTWINLTEAKKEGITPTERAYRVASEAIYS